MIAARSCPLRLLVLGGPGLTRLLRNKPAPQKPAYRLLSETRNVIDARVEMASQKEE